MIPGSSVGRALDAHSTDREFHVHLGPGTSSVIWMDLHIILYFKFYSYGQKVTGETLND